MIARYTGTDHAFMTGLKVKLIAPILDDKITVHGLRHTFATLLYGRTKNLLLVAKALGHSRVTTTQVYAHITDDDLEDALDAL
jgi:integrase/recombinase XerC